MPLLSDDFVSQGDITSNNQITSVHSFQYFIVRDIETGTHLDGHDVSGRRGFHELIRYKSSSCFFPIGCPEQNFPYHHRAGISINPNIQLALYFWIST